MGFSSEVTLGVWVGHDQVRALGFGETGAGAALPIGRDYMREAIRRYPVRDFPEPDGPMSAHISPDFTRPEISERTSFLVLALLLLRRKLR